jgi:hypothetical protein
MIQAAWAAIKTRGRLQARYNRLVRRFGGQNDPGAKQKAITAIAHTLLKIAYQACLPEPRSGLNRVFDSGLTGGAVSWSSPSGSRERTSARPESGEAIAA